jgi:hypothetical protein
VGAVGVRGGGFCVVDEVWPPLGVDAVALATRVRGELDDEI